MSTDLIVIAKESALDVFTATAGLEPYLAKIRAEIDAFVPDISTKKGRDNIASIAFKVAKSKTYLDGVGKELADVQKEIPKKIDAARKHVRDTLDAWKDEVRKPLTDWENAEESRIETIKQRIDELNQVANDRQPRASELIRERLAEVRAQIISEADFGEYTAAAAAAKDAAITAIESMLVESIKREDEAAELAKLRKESEERARKDNEARIAQEAADRARIEAEGKAKAQAEQVEISARIEAEAAQRRELELKLQAEKAEREKIEAQQRADRAEREAKEKAEREQAAKIKAESDELARREADKAHKSRINNAALKAFVANGMTEECAKLAVSLVAKKLIPSITINY